MMIGDSSMKTVNGRVVEAALGGGVLTGKSTTKQGPAPPWLDTQEGHTIQYQVSPAANTWSPASSVWCPACCPAGL